jgi:PTH2 family peptidyl-tRNA hydrolase
MKLKLFFILLLIKKTIMEYKMALIIRSDIKMSKGKIAAQIGHAMVDATVKAYTNSTVFFKWRTNGETIIALKADKKTLDSIIQTAERKGVNCGTVCDAGRTEVCPGTITVGFVGPASTVKINKLVGQLKLL